MSRWGRVVCAMEEESGCACRCRMHHTSEYKLLSCHTPTIRPLGAPGEPWNQASEQCVQGALTQVVRLALQWLPNFSNGHTENSGLALSHCSPLLRYVCVPVHAVQLQELVWAATGR